jgi:hypothetical protein
LVPNGETRIVTVHIFMVNYIRSSDPSFSPWTLKVLVHIFRRAI